MASYTKREAARLAAQGLSVTDIAAALTVTPSYIVQLQEDESFQALKAQLEAESGLLRHSTYREIDDNYDELERLVSGAMVENAEEIMMALSTNPIQLSKFMKDVNSLTRRSAGEQHSEGVKDIVPISLPAFMLEGSTSLEDHKVIHNAKNEIIEVDGENLVSMTGANLSKLVKSQTGESEHVTLQDKASQRVAKLEKDSALATNLRKALAESSGNPISPSDLAADLAADLDMELPLASS